MSEFVPPRCTRNLCQHREILRQHLWGCSLRGLLPRPSKHLDSEIRHSVPAHVRAFSASEPSFAIQVSRRLSQSAPHLLAH
eukprot:10601058-Alexandrium_andersonii.AAC.1